MKKYVYILEKIGFSEHAAKIYVALLELWPSKISDISEKTNLQRIQIYRTLPYLLEREFVLVTEKWKRKIYSPTSPELLREEYQKIQSQTFHVLDEFSKKYQNQKNKIHITFGEWKKSIENCYYDLLSSLPQWGQFLRITSETDSKKIQNEYQPKNYISQRDLQWIERSIILSEKAYTQKERKLEREEKVVNSKDIILDDNIMFTIYGDKISLIDFNKETSVIIESADIARFQEKIFKLLFKKL